MPQELIQEKHFSCLYISSPHLDNKLNNHYQQRLNDLSSFELPCFDIHFCPMPSPLMSTLKYDLHQYLSLGLERFA